MIVTLNLCFTFLKAKQATKSRSNTLNTRTEVSKVLFFISQASTTMLSTTVNSQAVTATVTTVTATTTTSVTATTIATTTATTNGIINGSTCIYYN